MKKLASLALAVLVSGLLWAGTAAAQDYNRTFSIGAGGIIRVSNVSGYVKVSGIAGNKIIVAGFKEGPDKALVQIEDNSSDDQIDLHARYPRTGSCNASVNFELRVPMDTDFNFERLSSVSGDVTVENVRGRLRADSVSGDVDVRAVSGLVSARTVSGNVNVEISGLKDEGEMKFASVSGNVNVVAPANLDAHVDMQSVSGSLKTNFNNVEVQEQRYGPGRKAFGRTGPAGKFSLRIESVSGRVSLTHN